MSEDCLPGRRRRCRVMMRCSDSKRAVHRVVDCSGYRFNTKRRSTRFRFNSRTHTNTQRGRGTHRATEADGCMCVWMKRRMSGWAGKRRGQFALTSSPSNQENRLFIQLYIATAVLLPPTAHTADCAAVSRWTAYARLSARPSIRASSARPPSPASYVLRCNGQNGKPHQIR